MDIRKFLTKDKDKAKNKPKPKAKSTATTATTSKGKTKTPTKSKAASSSASPSTSRRKSKSAPINIDDDDDEDDDDEMFQPTAPSTRRRTAASKKVDDEPAAAEETTTSSRKRDRGKVTGAAAGAAAGFGGGGEEEEHDGNAEPVKKKAKWIPRSDDPPNRGNKPLPIGAPDCLKEEVFVISGVLDSLLREECQDLVRQYGARCVSAPSKKVTYGIIGMEPGQSKLNKLKANKTPLIDEDELFRMINVTGKKGKNKNMSSEHVEDDVKMKEEDVADDDDDDEIKPAKSKIKKSKVTKEEEYEMKHEDEEDDIKPVRKSNSKKAANGHSSNASLKNKPTMKKELKAPPTKLKTAPSLWVDKYKPKSAKDLVGNNKLIADLLKWLTEWKDRFLRGDGHSMKLKDRRDMDQAAVLLVGPPGIGKTTAAHIVCREAGYEPHEFNASDVRNKAGVTSLAESVMVANSLSRYLKIGGSDGHQGSNKQYRNGQVLIMDEVDGMSGGDRGGGQELIRMIKKTKVPIICIANDDSSANMRSLANNCFKLRFRRPHTSTVSKRLSEIARREGFHAMQDQVLWKLAEGCNGDIRQMINLLQSWRVSSPALSYDDVKNRLDVEGKTVIQKSIFELSMSFFKPGAEGSTNSLMSRSDNYFADSDLVPLFIQENYINSIGASQSLEALADAAESIGEGDLCNAVVRGDQRWELMPACAIMSAIRPGTLVAGGLNSQPMFPSFLGNLSKGNKWKRIVQGLEMKIRAVGCTTSGSTTSFRLDYIPALTTCLVSPLILTGAGGIDQVIDRLDAYYLERDPDWLEILEAGVYSKGRGPLENIPTSVKTAFTREYNSKAHARSTVTGMRVGVKGADGAVVTSSKKAEKEELGILDDDDEEAADQNEGDDDAEVDIVSEFGKKGRGGKGKGKGKGRGGSSSTAGKSGSRSKSAKSSGGRSSSASSSRRGRGRGRGRGRK